MFDKESDSHPSFGLLGFHRIQCGKPMALFGSDLEHSTVIEMKLFRAKRERDLNRDWHHATDRVASVYMSQNQFSELLTSMNMGDGVPVTLNYTETDGQIEEPGFRSVTEQHRREFAEKARELADRTRTFMQDAEDILSGTGTMKKSDRERLLHSLRMMMQEIESNMPFAEKQFAEAMDKVVTDAKGTIEVFFQHRVTTAGLEKLAEDGEIRPPRLVENSD